MMLYNPKDFYYAWPICLLYFSRNRIGRLREYLCSILFSQRYKFPSIKSMSKTLILFLGNSLTKYIEKLEEIKKSE